MQETKIQGLPLDADFVVRGKEDEADRTETLIVGNKAFIIGCVRKYAYAPDAAKFDELVSVGLSAFHEALRTYDVAKGHFYPFAEMIIRRRLIDETRRHAKDGNVIFLGDIGSEPDREEGTPDYARPLDRASIDNHAKETDRQLLADEIQRYSKALSAHGLSFRDLVTHSPKHAALRQTYDRMLRAILSDAELVGSILEKHVFPVKKIEIATKIPRKKIERARIYMIGAVIIATGQGFDGLREYLPCLREE
ncbi:MAG: hypothetical protein LBR00_02740 [Clostridiales Family XIII bacterium]|jgi:RNA polymerase sigma factor|nr:hypothetical protein [Clostridiales Family XIII bacterium]